MSFADEMRESAGKLDAAYLEHRGRVAGEAVSVARALAPVESGEYKAGIVPFAGSPPGPPAEGGTFRESAGTPATVADKAAAVSLSRAAGAAGTFGVAATAEHSSYVEERRGVMQTALEAAAQLDFKGGDGGDL